MSGDRRSAPETQRSAARKAFLLALALASLVAGCHSVDPRVIERYQAGKALYEEKCRTVAGEKIYRKVEGVEGVLLMKVRPFGGPYWADPNWPGAAFALESYDDGYIKTFLAFKHPPTVPVPKGAENQHSGISIGRGRYGIPGYRHVDVADEKDGKRYRYTLVEKFVPTSRESVARIDPIVVKAPTTAPVPRYGITFEDHVIPEERALWVASSTVKVIDLETNEVLGEMLRYAWAGGGPTPASPSPWLRARECPSHPVATSASTRKFVDQVLVPVHIKE